MLESFSDLSPLKVEIDFFSHRWFFMLMIQELNNLISLISLQSTLTVVLNGVIKAKHDFHACLLFCSPD